MANILCYGNLTLDIINEVPHYPAEDEELRTLDQRRRSGGNAANTALDLARLGHHCALAASVADDASAQWLLDRLSRGGIDVSHCITKPGDTPTSYIAVNRQNGSRTIIHHRRLAELDADEILRAIDPELDWFHCEGRNVAALTEALQRLPASRRYRVSLEAEKARDGLDALFPLVDQVMLSRTWCEQQGFDEPRPLLDGLRHRFPGTPFTCTWGRDGAWYCDEGGNIGHVPAIQLRRVHDSTGAGDSFNAGLIHARLAGHPLDEAVLSGHRFAADRIGHRHHMG